MVFVHPDVFIKKIISVLYKFTIILVFVPPLNCPQIPAMYGIHVDFCQANKQTRYTHTKQDDADS